ncbi:MAG TPA: TVP38/TMEM64 family protein, partial [Thermoanaerobaculia bacterium]
MNDPQKHFGLKILLLAIIMGSAIAVYFSPLRAWLTLEHLRALVGQMRGFWYGPIFFILLYAAGCLFFFPATLFILSGGLIWGWKLGGAYALTGGCLGAIASFSLARYVGGDLLGRLGRVGEGIDRKLESAGFTAMLILRIIPIFPFAVLNYGAGLARIKTRDFFWATLIGTAPAHFVVAYSADALLSGTLTRQQAVERILLVGVLVGVVLVVPLLLRKRVEKAVTGSR